MFPKRKAGSILQTALTTKIALELEYRAVSRARGRAGAFTAARRNRRGTRARAGFASRPKLAAVSLA